MLFQAVLFFLFPIGIYCLVLAQVNRRERPSLVSGFWDCIGMLAAMSGFFLVFVPVLFQLLYERLVSTAAGSFNSLWTRWCLLWLCYYLALGWGAWSMLRSRRHKTLVYNVDTDFLVVAVPQAARMAGWECTSKPGSVPKFELRRAVADEAITAVDPAVQPVDHGPGQGEVAGQLAVEAFPAACHATLHWSHYEPEVRAALERHLDKVLEPAGPRANPFGSWLLVVSGMVFGLIIASVGLLYLLILLAPR